MVAVAVVTRSAMVSPFTVQASAASRSAGLLAISAFLIVSSSSRNCSFFATKSVSEFTSKITPVLPSTPTRVKPSAAIRSFFFAAFAIPFSRSQSIDFAMSPSHSVRAFLQSIIPAPVFSRNSFTNAAVIMIFPPFIYLCLSAYSAGFASVLFAASLFAGLLSAAGLTFSRLW